MMKKSGANSINLVKQVISVLSSITKSKAMAIKSKAEALKARLIMCSLLRNKRLPLAAVIFRKVHAILGVGSQQHEDNSSSSASCDEEYCKANGHSHCPNETEELGHVDYYCNYCNNNNNNNNNDDDDDKYPDLRHCLFDEYYHLENDDDQVQQAGGGDDDDDDPKNASSSVIDMVKNTKEQEGEDFRLEDEIDHVADLFITKFHKMMKLQKLESFKRYQLDMLARGAAA